MLRSFYLSVGLSILAAPAFAQISDLFCDDRARLQDMMHQTLGAERLAYGIRDPETVLEVWVVPRTGEWTMVQHYANGSACIVAIGENWEGLTPAAS